jgi:hypothetical protein
VGQDEFLRDGSYRRSREGRKGPNPGELAAGCQLSLTNPPHAPYRCVNGLATVRERTV